MLKITNSPCAMSWRWTLCKNCVLEYRMRILYWFETIESVAEQYSASKCIFSRWWNLQIGGLHKSMAFSIGSGWTLDFVAESESLDDLLHIWFHTSRISENFRFWINPMDICIGNQREIKIGCCQSPILSEIQPFKDTCWFGKKRNFECMDYQYGPQRVFWAIRWIQHW